MKHLQPVATKSSFLIGNFLIIFLVVIVQAPYGEYIGGARL